jgi:hypothetical protein
MPEVAKRECCRFIAGGCDAGSESRLVGKSPQTSVESGSPERNHETSSFVLSPSAKSSLETLTLLKILALGNQEIAAGEVKSVADVVACLYAKRG